MLRAVILVAVLHGSADADDLEVANVVGPPPELAHALEPAHAAERSALFDAAIPATLHPFARANLVLARADVWAAQAIALRARALATLDIDHDFAAMRAAARALTDYKTVTSAKLAGWRAIDRALAHHAFLLALDQRFDEATPLFRRLVTELPASPHAPFAHLALGDRELVAQQIAKAYEHYSAVVSSAAPPKLRAYALYRAGWLALDERGDERNAFMMFAEAIPLDPDGVIAWELRRGLVKAFALFGDPVDAYAVFEHLAPAHAHDMLDDLAGRWASNARRAEALAAYAELGRRAPRDPRACAWQAAATRLAHGTHDEALYFANVQRLVRIFARARFLPGGEACETAIVEATLDVARKPRTSPVLARQLSDLFLHAFPDRAASVLVR